MPGGEPLDEIKLGRYFAARDQLPFELEDDRGRAIETARSTSPTTASSAGPTRSRSTC
jgi:hypothetical protein